MGRTYRKGRQVKLLREFIRANGAMWGLDRYVTMNAFVDVVGGPDPIGTPGVPEPAVGQVSSLAAFLSSPDALQVSVVDHLGGNNPNEFDELDDDPETLGESRYSDIKFDVRRIVDSYGQMIQHWNLKHDEFPDPRTLAERVSDRTKQEMGIDWDGLEGSLDTLTDYFGALMRMRSGSYWNASPDAQADHRQAVAGLRQRAEGYIADLVGTAT